MTTRRIRRILVATDFSPASRPALQQATGLAKSLRAEIVIAHVLVPPTPLVAEVGVFPRAYDELAAQMRNEATQNLRRLLASARKAGLRATALLLRGTAHREIVRTARARKADLLVLGTHGRTGVARLFLGSVASRVAASAPCPVLTVPSDRSRRRSRARD